MQEKIKIAHDQKALLAWASYYGGLDYGSWLEIQNYYPSLGVAFEDKFELLPNLKFKQKCRQKFKNYNQSLFLEQIQKAGLSFVVYGEFDYPECFKVLHSPPLVIYYKGDLRVFNAKKFLTVVGSRTFASYAEYILNYILPLSFSSDLVVVSGLALGIDALAHQLVVSKKETGTRTIGIIGSGLDYQSFYPKNNWDLSLKIIENEGLVMSEYPPFAGAMPHHFLARNRLLAVISDITWVVQAGLKSGSLITANLALELGKNVATTPADIRDKSFEGNLQLIKNGAVILSEPEDLRQLVGLEKRQESLSFGFENPMEGKIFEVLGSTSLNLDQISIKTGLEVKQVAVCLTMLEMQGVVFNSGQNLWQRLV
jgi:DNA processing protein